MKRILIIMCISLTCFACEKDDYLVDGGISDPHVGTTTFQFLQSHNQLDTLAILIERAGLKEEVNGANTLFAPNDLSIKRYVNLRLAELRVLDPQAEFTINDIALDTLDKYMGGYIFSGKIKREDLTKEGEIFTAINGQERKISLEPRQDYNEQLSSPPEYVFFTFKNGETWDAYGELDDDDKIRVRTSNLISTNGIIHVLQGNHVLFNYESE